ncbi:hypothetical protein [Streptomyces sp. NPDC044948]|uniref:hypothetical protein n=1 Tax=Streptomyces sp. NPDC044948 TaxID=3157092 RepID=UPI0033E585DD
MEELHTRTVLHAYSPPGADGAGHGLSLPEETLALLLEDGRRMRYAVIEATLILPSSLDCRPRTWSIW